MESYYTMQPEHNPLLDPLPLTDNSSGRTSRFRMSAMQIMQEILSDDALLEDPKDPLDEPFDLDDIQESISPLAWDALLSAF